MNAIVTVETLTPAIFSQEGGIDAMLAKLESDVRSVATDVTTAKGRKEIASLAHKVARSKTAFDGLGKDLASEWKTKAKAIDIERARVWDRLEALQAEVRKPLDDYETAEAERLAGHNAALQAITDLAVFDVDQPSSQAIAERLAEHGRLPERDWQEFAQRAALARSETFGRLIVMKEAAVARESAAAELERLRAAEAERLRIENEDRIAAAAAEAATKAAEERAAQEAARVANEVAERERLAEQERLAVIARAEKAEREAKEAAEKSEGDRLAAIRKAEDDRVAAVNAERQRVADAEAAERAETERREADKAHRKQINSAALSALVDVGLTHKQGMDVIVAIVKGQIPAITIKY